MIGGFGMGSKMFRWRLLVLLTALVAGCTSVASQGPIISRYHGVHIDLFFLEWGAPVSSRELETGGQIYLWFAGRDSAYKPGHVDTDLIGNTAWWEGHRIRGFNPRIECGVRIVTFPDGTIRDVLVHESSKGWWEVGRCREVFGPAR